MSRIPNPFLGDEVQQRKPQQTPSGPGFLVMTRPPSGSNSYGGRGNAFFPSPSPSECYIPLSDSNNGQDNRRGRGKRFSGGGGRIQGSPRFFSPYQQSPMGRNGHMGTPGQRQGTPYHQNPGGNNGQRQGNPYHQNPGGNNGQRQGTPYHQNPGGNNGHMGTGQRQGTPYHQTPGGNTGHMGTPGQRQGTPYTPPKHRDLFGNSQQNRSFSGGRGGRNHGPISDIPIEKFVSISMVRDPWADFDIETPVNTPTRQGSESCNVSLDDSEIVIDSDTSVLVENSFEGGVSVLEGDSSPVPDTRSDSPIVVTSSTSEKEVGSDSTGDD